MISACYNHKTDASISSWIRLPAESERTKPKVSVAPDIFVWRNLALRN